jgi:hypothetical protein
MRESGFRDDNGRIVGTIGLTGNIAAGVRGKGAKGTSKSLLEVVRLLAEMAPDERTALVGLLKALG